MLEFFTIFRSVNYFIVCLDNFLCCSLANFMNAFAQFGKNKYLISLHYF